MKKTTHFGVGDSYAGELKYQDASVKYQDGSIKYQDGFLVHTNSIINYLKLLWWDYQDRQRNRKEVQRRLLKQRAIKRDKASSPQSMVGERHWSDRFLKSRRIKDKGARIKDQGARIKDQGAKIVLLLVFILLQSTSKAQTPLKPISIGDTVPALFLKGYQTPKGVAIEGVKLNSFKDQLVILDFWATWCAPCVKMIPKMDSLQKEYEGDVQFIPVSYQSFKEVQAFNQSVAKRGIVRNLNEVVGSIALQQLFPHVTLPHYVWINGKGVVIAITDDEEVTRENIKKAADESFKLSFKADYRVKHNLDSALFINGNGGNVPKLFYHRLLSPHQKGLAARISVDIKPNGASHIVATNYSITHLYRAAYSKGGTAFLSSNRNRVIVKDSTELIPPQGRAGFRAWALNNKYCYELLAPPVYKAKVFDEMIKDLEAFFPAYKAVIEKQEVECYVVQRTSQEDLLATKGGTPITGSTLISFELQNQPLKQFISMLDIKYLSLTDYPVVDETNYTGKVDLKLDANMTKVDSINEALKPYGLTIIKAKRPIDLLIIRDTPGYQTKK